MKAFFRIFLTMILALGLSSVAMAWGKGKGKGFKGGKHMPQRIMKQLNLTEEQKTKLHEMRKARKGTAKPLREQKKASHEKFQSLLKSDASEAELRKAHAERQVLRTKVQDNHFEAMLEMRKILTPEQRKKFHELMGKRKGKRRGGWGHGSDEDNE